MLPYELSFFFSNRCSNIGYNFYFVRASAAVLVVRVQRASATSPTLYAGRYMFRSIVEQFLVVEIKQKFTL